MYGAKVLKHINHREGEIMKKLKYYITIWYIMSKNAFIVWLNQRMVFSIFLFGKVARFAFFISFLYFLVSGTGNLAGYTREQIIFFYLTFNLVDILGQFLFREVYRFRPLLVSGDFDLVLSKPVSPLFRVLFGGADLIDLVTIPPLLAAIIFIGNGFSPSISSVVLYALLVINALVISAAFHIVVISVGIRTLEIDHTILIFRDLLNLGRLPIDIYQQPIKGILTFLIPVGIMISTPAKAFMGIISPLGVAISFITAIIAVTLSYRLWNYSLRFYTSASS